MVSTITKSIRESVAESGKPHIGMELGALHSGIEDALRMSASERLSEMRALVERKMVRLESPDDELAAVFRLEYDQSLGAWKSTKAVIDPGISETFKYYPVSKTGQ